ncbi:hypothetical protein C8Q80DRAFT_129408 [Daedaleopsis nitida]|nr:hypothetical protein C8Q80DRAFT_129408 [Daedaleopsis nitida]
MSKDSLLPMPSECRPQIWISSRQELCQILPELGRSQHNIAFEQTETPVLFLDGPKYIVDEWNGGKKLRLVFTRRYRFLPAQNAYEIAGIGMQHDGTSSTASAMQQRSSSVVLQDGLYLFPQGSQVPIAKSGDTHGLCRDIAVASDWSPVLPVSDAPPEILALLHARESKVPVSVILCRGAGLSPFALPEWCGCAYLGFFFLTQLNIETIELTEDDAKGLAVYGTRHWTFAFEWTPGGEDPHASSTTKPVPWWIKDSEASDDNRSAYAEERRKRPVGGTPLRHAFTLLPSHLIEPTSQFGASVQGWYCTKCCRINAQRNLCLQRCASCSTSNGLAPMEVEYARDVRGTDPTTFPMDKCDECVRRSMSDAPDGLRDFTYALSDTDTALVHHLFTRNHAHLQAVPTQLFHDIQAQVEMLGTQSLGIGRNGGQTVYSIEYASSSPSKFGNAKAKGKGKESAWPSDAPECVSRARDLMLRRGQLPKFASDLSIDHLTITAWRRSGNKKGCKLSARHAPVIILALGADVDLSFSRVSETGVTTAKQTGRASVPKGKSARRGVSEDMAVDGEDAPEPTSLDGGPARKRARTAKSKDDILVVTLFHGDMLVVEGGVFEYSMKRSGMNMRESLNL